MIFKHSTNTVSGFAFLLNLYVIQLFWAHGIKWFRVFGVGLWAASNREHPPVFSERNGLVRVLSVGTWRVKLLSPHAFVSNKGAIRRYLAKYRTQTILDFPNQEKTQ